jgi:hypothetical protein
MGEREEQGEGALGGEPEDNPVQGDALATTAPDRSAEERRRASLEDTGSQPDLSGGAAERSSSVEGAAGGGDHLAPYRRATWELELLISAALVFSLFQLPGMLNATWGAVQPTLSERIFILPFLFYYLCMLSVYALTIAFTTHFVLRSFWVGVCGLRAVFPRGIDWDSYDGSDWSRRIHQRITMPLVDLERLVDRVASGIFAALFAMLLILTMVFTYATVGMLVAMVVSQFFLPELDLVVVFYVLMALFLVPAMVLAGVEAMIKRKPEREHTWPRLVKLAAWLSKAGNSSTVGRLYQPIVMAFATNLSTKATSRATMASVFVLVSIFVATVLIGSGEFGFDSYHFFPSRSGERSVRTEHYDDQRPITHRERLPMIQSMVIEGPYVQLFVPFHVNRDLRSLKRVCSELESLRGEGFFRRRGGSGEDPRQQQVLECLEKVYEVQLDSRRLIDRDWVFYRHPLRGLEGLLLQIDVRGLASGRHTLQVSRLGFEEDGKPVVLERKADESEEQFAVRRAENVFVIPFWI